MGKALRFVSRNLLVHDMTVIMRPILIMTLMLTLLLNTAHAKKYYSCSELLKSVAYPTPEDARKMRLKLLVSDGGLTLIKETAKIGISAGLGLTGINTFHWL
jgi:hypothetical protein